jgi:alpha-1,2-mannosyltransferase
VYIDVLTQIQDRFGLSLSSQIQLQFVHLHQYRYLLRPIPFCSLLLESLGSMALAYLGLFHSLYTMQQLPDVFIDTTGCAFTYVPASIVFGCHIVAYVHYPTISTDMLQLVWEQRRIRTNDTKNSTATGTYNHQSYIAASTIITYMKLLYYLAFALLYGCVGSLSSMVMVNSTWTYRHIQSLWMYASYQKRIRIVYPPCSLPQSPNPTRDSRNNTTRQEIQSTQQRHPMILSIGQFRPEKDHTLQIEAMALYLKKYYHPTTTATVITDSIYASNKIENIDDSTSKIQYPQLVLVGSCRNSADQQRLDALRQLCRSLNIEQHVQFVINEPFATIQDYLYKSSIGIHTVRCFRRFVIKGMSTSQVTLL